MTEHVIYDDDLQPASAYLVQQTHMSWSPIQLPVVQTDAVSLEIAAALEEISGAVAARVAQNNALVMGLSAADVATGAAIHHADDDGANGIGSVVPQ